MVGRCGPGSHQAGRKGGWFDRGDSVDSMSGVRGPRGGCQRPRRTGNIGGDRVEVQLFGTQKNQDTRRALRFWSERRVKVHFVDLKERAASKGELQRFVQKFGLTALIDKTAKRYQELGLGASRLSDERWLTLLSEEPLLLQQPLTRFGGKLTLGVSESEWAAWIEAERVR